MPLNEDLARFIQSSFRSIWSLELLLLLKSEPHPWSRDTMVSTLRGSELVVSKALDSLVAAGLATVDEDGNATYMPVSDEVAKFVGEVESLYKRRPDMVRRLIIASTTPGLTAFADAFRLGREK
jgi:hypothetical protein